MQCVYAVTGLFGAIALLLVLIFVTYDGCSEICCRLLGTMCPSTAGSVLPLPEVS